MNISNIANVSDEVWTSVEGVSGKKVLGLVICNTLGVDLHFYVAAALDTLALGIKNHIISGQTILANETLMYDIVYDLGDKALWIKDNSGGFIAYHIRYES